MNNDERPISTDTLISVVNCLHTLTEAFTKELETRKPTILKVILESFFSTFIFQQRTSDKMGVYGVAEQENNDPQKFAEALDVLVAHKATIKDRFHPEGYTSSFWIYNGRIYKAALKK